MTDRDQSVERLLRKSLASESGATDACLDAERLAAWVDGGLDDRGLELAESHVAGCARCQAMLAAIAKSSPVEPSPQPWWRRSWGLGLLVPLTAGAAAIALWVASPAYQRPSPPASVAVQSEAADAKKPDAPAVTDRFQAPSTPIDVLSAPAASAPLEKSGANEANKSAANEEEKTAAANAGRRDEREARKLESPAEQLGAVGSPAPPASAPAAAASADAAAPGRLRALSQQATLSTEILSPNPSIRWRIGAAGSIQYSTSGGASWEPIATGISADLSAGASPSPSVCWVVGRAGTVVLTTDGRRWQRATFPETVDLTSVQAGDGRTATVTGSDGRAFRTADGGATWTPLQDF